MILTEEQWQLVKPLLPPAPPLGRRGRPALDQRLVLAGILWKLSTRSPWDQVPPCFGAYQTCYLHYRLWKKNGVLRKIIHSLVKDVAKRGKFDFRLALETRLVRFEKRGRHILVYIPAGAIHSWQLATAMLYYQYVAYGIEKKQGLASPTDPLAGMFSPAQ